MRGQYDTIRMLFYGSRRIHCGRWMGAFPDAVWKRAKDAEQTPHDHYKQATNWLGHRMDG